MNITEIVATTRSLLQTKAFHLKQATHYMELFNAHAPAGCDLVETVTPLQQFYQRMCEHHSAAALRLAQEIAQFERIVDAA